MNAERALREMERRLIRLHELIAADQSDSDAADAIRDQMDQLARFTTPLDLLTIRELSGDLYMLTGEEVAPESMREMAAVDVRVRIAEAFGKQRWADLLRLLRAPHGLPLDRVAYVRARAWSSLGFHRAALKFYEHA